MIRFTKMRCQALVLLTTLAPLCGLAGELNGILQLGLSYADSSEPGLRSHQQKGTGITRYDSATDGLDWQMLALEYRGDLLDDLSFQVTALAYPDGNRRIGITEAFLDYRPLTQGWKHNARLGLFYPGFSFENPDTAWNSPYTYTFSAINSWIAEELRVLGGEWVLTAPFARRTDSHHFQFVAGIYTDNDPLGTLLTWRGWGLNQRQALYGDRIEFARYPSLYDPIPDNPSWVEPNEEIDSKLGGYAGVHWRYKRSSEVRLYYYDNRADETRRIQPMGQYAWDTQFTSLAWQYRFTVNTRLQAQVLTGNTVMGRLPDGRGVVQSPIDALYVLVSQRYQQHRLSLRYDRFMVGDEDAFPIADNNRSDGYAYTMAWRYDFSDSYQLGLEALWLSSTNDNRPTVGNAPRAIQRQLQAVLQYRF